MSIRFTFQRDVTLAAIDNDDRPVLNINVDPFRQFTRSEWSVLVILLAEHRCERCKISEAEQRLNAHHRDGNIENNCLANGECLCIPCHNAEHVDRRRASLVNYNKSEQGRIRSSEIGHDNVVHLLTSDRGRSSLKRGQEIAKKGWETRKANGWDTMRLSRPCKPGCSCGRHRV